MTAPHLAPVRSVFFQDAHFPFSSMLYKFCQAKNHSAPIWDLSDYTAKSKEGTGSARDTREVLQDMLKHWKLSQNCSFHRDSRIVLGL